MHFISSSNQQILVPFVPCRLPQAVPMAAAVSHSRLRRSLLLLPPLLLLLVCRAGLGNGGCS
jgi:hypothetical protein